MTLNPILYAEDEENDAYFLKRAFKEVNILHPLVIARDGQEAIECCRGDGSYLAFSLILLDLNMPKRSGIEVLDWIRKESSMRTVPIVILTSSLQESDIELAYTHGANAYLVKPCKRNELNDIARSIKDFWLIRNRTAGKHIDIGQE